MIQFGFCEVVGCKPATVLNNKLHSKLQNFAEIYTYRSDIERVWVYYCHCHFDRPLHPIVPITQKLQGRTVNIMRTFDEFNMCLALLDYLSTLTEDEYATIYN